MANPSIAGQWHGEYSYKGQESLPLSGGSWTALISEDSGKIEGTMHDDDPALDKKATVTGTFTFPAVEFTKFYLKPGHSEHVLKEDGMTGLLTRRWGDPVEYEGTMSEDGSTMNGRWLLASKNGVSSGTWTASRI